MERTVGVTGLRPARPSAANTMGAPACGAAWPGGGTVMLSSSAASAPGASRARAAAAPGARVLAQAALATGQAVDPAVAAGSLFVPPPEGGGGYWSAPAEFLGDQSAALDGLLEVQLRLAAGTWPADG